ncbi:MAG: phosphopentomutase, partial [Selenomonadaceae bacterium]|nr:phosphopentomutase [Selenomonadaceae bacterium]
MNGIKRVFVIVLDSFGIGREPDAEDFGDKVCNTLASLAASPKFHVPNLRKLGLFNIDGVSCGEREP